MILSLKNWMGKRREFAQKILDEAEKRWRRWTGNKSSGDDGTDAGSNNAAGSSDAAAANSGSTTAGAASSTFSAQENHVFIHLCNSLTGCENLLCHPNHLMNSEGRLLPVLSKIEITERSHSGNQRRDHDENQSDDEVSNSNTLSPAPVGKGNPVWYLTHIFGANRALTASFKASVPNNNNSNTNNIPLTVAKRVQFQPSYYFDWRMALLRNAVVDYFSRHQAGTIGEIKRHCEGFVGAEVGRLDEAKVNRDEESGVMGGMMGGVMGGALNNLNSGEVFGPFGAPSDPDEEEFAIPLAVLTAAGFEVDKQSGSVRVKNSAGGNNTEGNVDINTKTPQFLKHLAKSKRWTTAVDPTPLPRRSAERIMKDTTLYELRKLVGEFADMDVSTKEFVFIGMLAV
jgi:hypothetical protein